MGKEIPRTLHLYWGKDKPLSWLRWMTVKTFAMLNPDWRVIVWHPDRPGKAPPWSTREHSHYAWAGPDWFKKLKDAGSNVEVREAQIRDFPPLSEVHRSDLFRWRLLHAMGGFWSDIDIVYFRPMDVLDLDYGADALLCWGEIEELAHWQAIGFLAGRTGSPLFSAMEELGVALARAPNLGYQSLGTDLLLKFAEPGATEAVGARIGQIPQHAVYPFSTIKSQQDALWGQKALMDIRDNTVGVHWFAAQRRSCAKEAAWKGLDDVQGDRGCGGVKWAMGQAGLVDLSKDMLKYSIIMPYIDRVAQLHNTLVSYRHWYLGRSDWELVLVVDSKCKQRPDLDALVDHWRARGLNIVVLDFQADGIYSPAPLFNAGARVAQGEFLVLTSPEIYHNADVLAGLDAEFDQDRHRYVTCACLNLPRRQALQKVKRYGFLAPSGREKWIQHGVHRPAQYHFCSALGKDLYEAIGGFDEAFARGFCFDDDDFRDTVIKSGVTVVQRDDLVTLHQYHDPCEVPDKMGRWRVNKAIYEAKHGVYEHLVPSGREDRPPPALAVAHRPLTFACVLKSGGPFTPEYVVKLRNMLDRHAGIDHKFFCLTDMEVDCQTVGLMDDLPGWWSKIELFRPGLFNAGLVVYFDLDTLILGSLDQLVALAPGFHALRPWNRHNMGKGYCGSGFMVWDAGQFGFIYDRFTKRDMEQVRGGDQEYISKALSGARVKFHPLQDTLGSVYSYKRQCRGRLPPGAKVVCFHGRPRIHECQDQWVQEAWR